MKAKTKNQKLAAGDTVGIIAPGSPIKRDLLQAGCDELRKLGYAPVYSDSIFDEDLYFAGAVSRRARELEEMFERRDVRAIICARGGYGCNYLLDKLNLDLIGANPKIFVGYSDVTTLLSFFHDRAGMVTLHGPMVTKDWASGMVEPLSWQSAVSAKTNYEIKNSASPVVYGESEGVLYGGCLTLLAASLGTPYEINTAGTLLFLEDVAVKPFQLDRLLMQLKLAGKFSGVKGIIFGEMVDCTQHAGQGYTLPQIVTRIVGDLGIPVALGLGSGHVSKLNTTLPLGVRAQMSVREEGLRLRILEPATG